MRIPPSLIATIALVSSVLPLSAFQTQQDASKSGASSSSSGTQTAAPVKDAPAPEPTPALKTLLDAIDKQLQSKQYEAALSSADAALKGAQTAQDHVGEAMVQTQKATALASLNKTEESIASWKSAAEAWRQVPDGPGQVTALTNASVLLMSSDPEEAKQLVAQAIAIARAETSRPLQAARALYLAALRAYLKRQLGTAPDLAEAALSLLQKLSPISLEVALSLNSLGNVAGDVAIAERYYKRALALLETVAPGSPDEADCLFNLGNLAFVHGDFAAAESYFKRELEVREKLAPGSLAVAINLTDLGNAAHLGGDLAAAEDYFKLARDTMERLAPGSPVVAGVLENLGNVALERGDIATAQSCFERALKFQEKLSPGSLEVANNLLGLGKIADQRGDLAAAQNYCERALELLEKLFPGSMMLADALNELGNVAYHRGDFAAAESYCKRALGIAEKLAPRSVYVTISLGNLGNVARRRGDLVAAESYFKRAQAVQNQLPQQPLVMAEGLMSMGDVALDRSDLATAENYFKRALDIREKIAPDSLNMADSLYTLGEVAYLRRDLAAAESYNRRALEIREKLSPGSIEVAESLINLGVALETLQHSEEALPLYSRASDILETQRGHIAGSEARRLLVEAHTDAFTALLGAYLALHQNTDAFNTLERARGRSLCDNLFEHQHIDFDKDVPPTLLAQQKTLDNDRSIALKERERLDPDDPRDQPGYTKNDARLQQINVKQRQLEDEIRSASPRYANLQYPRPLDLNAVQHTLDPGTLLLEYAIDEQKSYLFTVTNNTLNCYPIAVTRKELLARVQALCDSVEKQNAPRNPAVAIALYNLLLRPAQKQIQAAQRLLFCPEQALWKLPFCALIDNNNAAAPHYLVESKPIHSIVAMNVYAQLLKGRNQPRSAAHSLLAFGDPAYRPTAQNQTASNGPDAASVALRQTDALASNPASGAPSTPTQPTATEPPEPLLLGGHSFERRAITGEQVRAIGALFGRGAVVHLGKEATRSIVFKEAGSARLLHFACHGWLDGRDPLASYLALTPEQPTEQFGMLAAYDVIQSLRLNAELVTLAACETGAGEQSSTEGVIGLTRAFEYAGARSVLVSLWEIDANSSSELLSGTDPLAPGKGARKSEMAESFYGALIGGKSKDEALRVAQMALIRGKRMEYRDPRHWAAFSLQGDWR